MMKFILFLFIVINSTVSFAREHQMIDTLGSSSKGQFVALEQYGYKSHSHSYYVKIQVMNVWTEEYVGQTIEVEMPAHRPFMLEKARARAKELAKDQLTKYDIKA